MAAFDDRDRDGGAFTEDHLSYPLSDASESFQVLDTFIYRMAYQRDDEAGKAAWR